MVVQQKWVHAIESRLLQMEWEDEAKNKEGLKLRQCNEGHAKVNRNRN